MGTAVTLLFLDVVMSAVHVNPGRTSGTSSSSVTLTLKFVACRAEPAWPAAWIGLLPISVTCALNVLSSFGLMVPPKVEQYSSPLPMLKFVSACFDENVNYGYRLMQTHDRGLLDEWMANWNDLVDFEVSPVITPEEAGEKVAARIKQSTAASAG